MGAAASTVAMNELGKLLAALQDGAKRASFRNGQAVPGVNLGAIPASVVSKLRSLSDECLKVVSDVNIVNLQDGLGIQGTAGIAAV